MTTNERMNIGRYKHFHANSNSNSGHGHGHGGHGHSHGGGSGAKSPFDKGCRRNTLDFCGFSFGGVFRPGKEDWSKRFSVDDDSQSLLKNEYV